jgi:hypothetical protein
VLQAAHDRLVGKLHAAGLLPRGWSVLPFELEAAGRRLEARAARVAAGPLVGSGRPPAWGEITAADVRELEQRQRDFRRLLEVRSRLGLMNSSPGSEAA